MGRSKVLCNSWLSFLNLRTTSSNLSNVNVVQHDMCAGESGLEEESVHENYSFNSDKNHHGKDIHFCEGESRHIEQKMSNVIISPHAQRERR